jgi:hypothetical protein
MTSDIEMTTMECGRCGWTQGFQTEASLNQRLTENRYVDGYADGQADRKLEFWRGFMAGAAMSVGLMVTWVWLTL